MIFINLSLISFFTKKNPLTEEDELKVSVLIDAGRLHFKNGNYINANKCFIKVLKITEKDPSLDDSEIYENLIYSLRRIHSYNAAIDYLIKYEERFYHIPSRMKAIKMIRAGLEQEIINYSREKNKRILC